jgi:hypothetical protein
MEHLLLTLMQKRVESGSRQVLIWITNEECKRIKSQVLKRVGISTERRIQFSKVKEAAFAFHQTEGWEYTGPRKKRAASKKNKDTTTIRKSLRSEIESQNFIVDFRWWLSLLDFCGRKLKMTMTEKLKPMTNQRDSGEETESVLDCHHINPWSRQKVVEDKDEDAKPKKTHKNPSEL